MKLLRPSLIFIFGLSILFAAYNLRLPASRAQKITARPSAEARDISPQPVIINKVAPDLDETVTKAQREGRATQRVRVLLQLNPEQTRAAQKATESQRATAKVALDNNLAQVYQGALKGDFPQVGLIAAELPLSKIRELQNDPTYSYVSPDRPVASFGHIETTIAAAYEDGRTEATNIGDTTGDGVGVAVLDSGIDPTHNALKTSSSHRGVVYSKSFLSGVAANVDLYGHGTHVATLLDATEGFKQGAYTGVAYDASLISLTVLDNQGRGATSNVVAAIDWCITNKATYNIRVINISLGAPARDSYLTDPLCLAARRAHSAGIVVVASAGNTGKTLFGQKIYGGINSPGIDPSVITVGALNTYGTATRADDTVATFSSRGPTRGYTTVNGVRKYDNLIKPDILAPGNRLIGACAPSSQNQSNSLIVRNPTLLAAGNKSGEKMIYLSGTSMAAPLVAGAAALLIETNPTLTPSLVKAILQYTAQPLPGVNTLEQGAGRLNVEGAVRIANIVKQNPATLTNGSAMLTAAFDVSYQQNDLNAAGSETIYWGQGVITNYGFLTGSELMTKWQGMYAPGKILSDGTNYASSTLTLATGNTTTGVSLYNGAITNNGVVLGDGILFASGVVLGDNIIGQGVVLGDGIVLGDGVVLGDGLPRGDQVLFGDNTAAMQPAP